MAIPPIKYCPGTLSEGYSTFSRTALKRVFMGKKVNHVIPYPAPNFDDETDALFVDNRKGLSISGVQEKFSVVLDKNKLRLIKEGEQGTYILKPIPGAGKKNDQMPANEHLTMQIARQVFDIETAENAIMFFENGAPAYITKRFDVKQDGSKKAQEDFAALAELTPQTHGENYKYEGNYLQCFNILKKYVPAYQIEAPKLFKLILFNYLFSNGDAHFKNFSLIETSFGDFKLSPAYDLLNSRIHIEDRDFALSEGLLPPQHSEGKIKEQFIKLGELAAIPNQYIERIMKVMTTNEEKVKMFISRSFLSEKSKRAYEQSYLTRLKKLKRL